MKQTTRRLSEDQTGIVSIMVTIIMMLVISLLVIGFGTVTRRNVREALDRQLSTQAYYAAETGVNDVLTALNKGSLTDADLLTSSYATDCSGAQSLTTKLSAINHVANQNYLNADGSVAYTCLLANPEPNSLVINVPINDTESTHVNPSAATNLMFTWESQDPSNGSAASCPTTFQPQSAWTGNCPYGILRLDLYKVTGGNAAAAANNTATVYLLPSAAGAASPTAITYNAPTIVKANCSASSKTCSATLLDASDALFSGDYYVRTSNLYLGSGNVTISPSSAASTVTFKDSEILIDVTGKAQDELRRVQERISNRDVVTPKSLNGVASGSSVCKRFTVLGSGTSATPADLCAP